MKESTPPVGEPGAPMPIEVCWRIRTPNNKVVTCGIYRDAAPGLEVRAFFGADDLLRSSRVPEIGTARDIAEAWKRAVLERGFVQLAEPETTM